MHTHITLDANFPGGNVILERIKGDHIYLRQDIRDSKTWWFFWHFRVRGAAGHTLHFHFTDGEVIGTRGPAVSVDGGVTWVYRPQLAVDNANFNYAFADDAEEVRFCFAIPYLESDLKRFLEKHADSPYLHSDVLCTTRAGRTAEVLYVGSPEADCKHKILLTSRHHACESIATYTMEGLLAYVLSDTAEAQWLRDHVRFMCVPFMDKDGVEQGDQGKLRSPRDHNRDYIGESLYATTRTLRDIIPAWGGDRLRIALDLHCPWIRGPHNEVVYFVGGPDMKNWAKVTQFCHILASNVQDELPYHVSDNLPYGQAWNTASNSSDGRSFSSWAASQKGIGFGSSIEIPYANVGDVTVTADKACAFGADLARAMVIWLDKEYA